MKYEDWAKPWQRYSGNAEHLSFRKSGLAALAASSIGEMLRFLATLFFLYFGGVVTPFALPLASQPMNFPSLL